jgi:SNF2 family DNA or RNA helicase
MKKVLAKNDRKSEPIWSGTMGLYELAIDKELLDLGTVCIDESIKEKLKEALHSETRIQFIKEDKISRVFKVNWSEGSIEGRGIKSFFKSTSSNIGFLEPQEDGSVKISFHDKIEKNDLYELGYHPKAADRTEKVLNQLIMHSSHSEKLFHCFENAKPYSNMSNFQELICLSHLREMEIFEYQVKTVQSVINQFRGRVLLCDEVGLGKTVEACMAMLEYIMRGLVKKILILVPPSLVEQWYNELRRKFNQDFIKYDDPEFKSHGEERWKKFDKVIVSIATAKRKENARLISDVDYDLIIVDEAHHLKNRKTQAWQFVNTIRKKYIYLLTATPVQNNLEELYNLITLLKPGQLKTYSYFKRQFIATKDGIEAKNVSQLKSLVSDVMIRNRRSDIGIKFTKRFATTHHANLLKEEQELYSEISGFIRDRYHAGHPLLSRFILKNLQEEMGSSFVVVNKTIEKLVLNEKIGIQDKNILLGFLSRSNDILKKNSGITPKLLSMFKIINEFEDKVIIFTKFKKTQEFIVEFLQNNGVKVAQFHGGLTRKEKEAQIIKFKESSKVLVSTESGGEGRNLQFCCGMINYDLPWNPMAIEQRIGRIHRIGQTKDVYIFNLTAANTLEQYILELLDKKINMFELVVGEVDLILGDIEEEEEFSDIIMNAWTTSHDMNKVKEQIDILGNKLLENKKQYLKMKELDNGLFGD